MEKIKNHFSEFWYMYALGVMVVLMTVVYGRLIDYETENENEINSVYYMTQFETEDITAVSFLGNEDQYLSFIKKEDGTWVYKEDESLAIEQAGPQYMVELLKEISTEYQVENAEDISIYGLSEDCPYIEFVAKGQTYRIYVGDYNETVKRYYAYIAGGKDVYGIKINIAEILDYTLEDYLLKEDSK